MLYISFIQVVRFYCEPCETCICILCTFNEHKDHEISQFGEAVMKYKENIESQMQGCQKKIDKFDSQLEDLNKYVYSVWCTSVL